MSAGLISLSDDVLGFGKILGGRDGTEECGAKPGMLAFKSDKNRYNDCIKNVEARKERLGKAQIDAQLEIEKMRIQNELEMARMKPSSPIPTKWIIIGVAVLIVLFLLFRR